jgi:hypothetical protein
MLSNLHLMTAIAGLMNGGSNKPNKNKPTKIKKIYYGAQRDLKKTERRPTQSEAFNAHQVRYWGLNEIHKNLKDIGYPIPKKLMKEIKKYKDMAMDDPTKVDKYFKFIEDKEAQLKEAENNLRLEEERLRSEAEKIKQDEKILKDNAATKIQSLVRMRKAKKELKALKKSKKPDLSKAATKIQSLVRMRKAKKQLEALKKAKKEQEEFPDPFPEDKYYPEEENVYDDEDQYEQDQQDDEEEFMNQTIKDMPDFELLDTIKMLNNPNTPDKMKRNQIKTIKEIYNIKTLQEVEDEYKKRFEKKEKAKKNY